MPHSPMKNYGKLIKMLIAVVALYIVYRIYKAYKESRAAKEFEAWDARDYMYSTIPAKDMSNGPGVTPMPSSSTPSPLPKAIGLSTDLLPAAKPRLDDFSEYAPKDALAEQNFLSAEKMIGIDTINGSLKNPNYSLRADPAIKKNDEISPWSVSTFTADPLRKKLDC